MRRTYPYKIKEESTADFSAPKKAEIGTDVLPWCTKHTAPYIVALSSYNV